MAAKSWIYKEESDDEESDEDESNNEDSEEEKSEDNESKEEESDDKKFDDEEDMELPYQIKRFSFEISSKCQGSVNPQSTPIYFLKMLSTYSWEAKVLIMLAAFSVNIGEFSLVNHQKRLGSKLAILKGCNIPVVPSHIQQSLTQFIKSVLHLTECIVELAESSSNNSSPIVPIACYWVVTSVVLTYASYFARLSSIDLEWLIVDGEQLSSLTAKLKDLIADCCPILEKKREEVCYQALCHAFSNENLIPSTNLDVLKLLFNVKDGDKKKPIYDGAREEMIGLHLLKNKSLLLFISSSLDTEEYFWEIFSGLRWTTKLHVLWIPILDSPALCDAKIIKQYRYLADKCSLLSVRNLKKTMTPGFIRFVKEKLFPECQKGGEPIIVSLDHHGRIVHNNALHMILMRALDFLERVSTTVSKGDGTIPLLQNMLMERALPLRDFVRDIDKQISDFAGETNDKINDWLRGIKKQVKNPIYNNIYTSEKENDLWEEVTWCTKLMASRARSPISKWVNKNHYIFFIGGNNIKWIETFVSKVLLETQFNSQWTIKIAYIGSNMEVASVINREKICNAPHESTLPFYWARLRSIFLSRIKFLNESHCDEECDEIVEGLKKLLSYEEGMASVDKWAVLCKGNKIVVCDLGDKMLAVMNEFEKWKESAIAKGFERAFRHHHHQMLATIYTSHCHPSCALNYPSNFDKIPKNVNCPQCCCNMQKFVTFRCYHGYDCKVDEDEDDGDVRKEILT